VLRTNLVGLCGIPPFAKDAKDGAPSVVVKEGELKGAPPACARIWSHISEARCGAPRQ
jgi:hypothetical protein